MMIYSRMDFSSDFSTSEDIAKPGKVSMLVVFFNDTSINAFAASYFDPIFDSDGPYKLTIN